MSRKSKVNAEKVAAMMDKQAGTHVGSIVMWTLLSPSVASADLKAMYAKEQLDWDKWGPEDLDGEVTFHKALAEAKRVTTGYRFVTIFEGKEKKVIGIVKEDVDQKAEDVRYKTDWTGDAVKVTYDKVNDAVKATNTKHPVATLIYQTFKKLSDLYTTPDFTRFLVRNIKENGGAIQLRPTGGVYFMPAANYKLVLQHKAVVEACGSEFTILNVKEDEISKADLGRSAMRSMGEELKALEEELEKWAATPPRADTLQRRLESYKGLKAKAEMYAGMLQVKADDLLTNLAAVQKSALDMLGIVESKKEKKAAKETQPKKATPKKAKVVVQTEEPVAPTKKVKVQGKKAAAPADKKVPIKQAIKQARAKNEAEEKATKKAAATKKAQATKAAKKATSKVKVKKAS